MHLILQDTYIRRDASRPLPGSVHPCVESFCITWLSLATITLWVARQFHDALFVVSHRRSG